MDDENAEMDRTAVENCLRGHKSSPRARDILDRAFGGDYWQREIDNTVPEQRQLRFVELYEDLLLRSCATHVLRFEVDTKQGRHKYFLLHASQDKRAFAAMKEAIDRANRKRERERETSSLSPELLINTDVNRVIEQLRAEYAGRRIRWAGEKYSDPSVRRFAIDETPLFPRELPALKAALLARNWAEKNAKGATARPLAFNFPYSS